MGFTAINVRLRRKCILQEGLWSGLSTHSFPLGSDKDSWKLQPMATLSPLNSSFLGLAPIVSSSNFILALRSSQLVMFHSSAKKESVSHWVTEHRLRGQACSGSLVLPVSSMQTTGCSLFAQISLCLEILIGFCLWLWSRPELQQNCSTKGDGISIVPYCWSWEISFFFPDNLLYST